jgi:hypothetical protein
MTRVPRYTEGHGIGQIKLRKSTGDTKHPEEFRRRLVGGVRVVSSSFIVSVRSTFPGYRVVP